MISYNGRRVSDVTEIVFEHLRGNIGVAKRSLIPTSYVTEGEARSEETEGFPRVVGKDHQS
jgi:hypothetical protein